MNHKKTNNNFLDYINKPISRDSVLLVYDSQNIVNEKCELYSDYIESLLILAFDTYLGDDITNLEQQTNHFNWCWNKNVLNFEKEGVFINSVKLYNYFLEFMLEVYYQSIDKGADGILEHNLIKLWEHIFNYDKIKTQSDIDTLIEIYKIFESSLKK
jgi:hypothetical protein